MFNNTSIAGIPTQFESFVLICQMLNIIITFKVEIFFNCQIRPYLALKEISTTFGFLKENDM